MQKTKQKGGGGGGGGEKWNGVSHTENRFGSQFQGLLFYPKSIAHLVTWVSERGYSATSQGGYACVHHVCVCVGGGGVPLHVWGVPLHVWPSLLRVHTCADRGYTLYMMLTCTRGESKTSLESSVRWSRLGESWYSSTTEESWAAPQPNGKCPNRFSKCVRT